MFVWFKFLNLKYLIKKIKITAVKINRLINPVLNKILIKELDATFSTGFK